jgi:hypothetical protein
MPPGHGEEVLQSVRGRSLDCRQNAAMVNDGLKDDVEPGLAERRGLLADRYEVYAMRLPRCGRDLFVVSLDRRGNPASAMIHGFVRGGGSAFVARDVVIRHRRLSGAPSWET